MNRRSSESSAANSFNPATRDGLQRSCGASSLMWTWPRRQVWGSARCVFVDSEIFSTFFFFDFFVLLNKMTYRISLNRSYRKLTENVCFFENWPGPSWCRYAPGAWQGGDHWKCGPTHQQVGPTMKSMGCNKAAFLGWIPMMFFFFGEIFELHLISIQEKQRKFTIMGFSWFNSPRQAAWDMIDM